MHSIAWPLLLRFLVFKSFLKQHYFYEFLFFENHFVHLELLLFVLTTKHSVFPFSMQHCGRLSRGDATTVRLNEAIRFRPDAARTRV